MHNAYIQLTKVVLKEITHNDHAAYSVNDINRLRKKYIKLV